ncbi:DUF4164 family protein [Methylobacterium aerolatum]|uniref:DUF4164 family protein n=1 Tax=Methylobacterium aerolatum TaxID=418708 RepID=A0ABU0I448_9HYPH|nr:DUF4164 family protein [Methylobacterium aerolatum]MDQ0449387.1 hypothetical protein [Methylobacterium aerolatum]GJD36664.1 hypothetical protein FMGBMHLM_3587 [Methylobacterium aerolatum]
MTTPPDAPSRDPLADALRKLDAALSRLEAAAIRRLESEDSPDDRDTELSLMTEDRARLAAALDAASARLAQVEANSGEVGQRLDRAIAAVAGVLERH